MELATPPGACLATGPIQTRAHIRFLPPASTPDGNHGIMLNYLGVANPLSDLHEKDTPPMSRKSANIWTLQLDISSNLAVILTKPRWF